MANNNKNPWDDDGSEDIWSKKKKNKVKTPEDLISEFQNKLKDNLSFGGGGGSGGSSYPSIKMILSLLFLAIIVLWGISCYYKIEPNQVGVVLRFGKAVRTESEGPHLHLRPVERVYIVNVTSVNRIDGTPIDSTRSTEEKTLILTGDQNLIHTYYTIQWRIKDVKNFLFTARNPESTIKAAAESALREVVGQMDAQGILTTERDVASSNIEKLLQEILDKYGIGVKIVRFQLTRSEPPEEVIGSFNELQTSKNDAEKEVNESYGYAGDIVPRARGQAQRVLQEAQAYRDKTIAIANGEAERLRQVRIAYSKNPSVARKRQYYDMMVEVLGENKIVLVDKEIGNGSVPYLSLNELTKNKKVK